MGNLKIVLDYDKWEEFLTVTTVLSNGQSKSYEMEVINADIDNTKELFETLASATNAEFSFKTN